AMRDFANVFLYYEGEVIAEIPVWHGIHDSIRAVADKDLIFTLPRDYAERVNAHIATQTPQQAPIAQGQEIGQLVINIPSSDDVIYPLQAESSIDKAGYLQRVAASIKFIMFGR
ncbi:MAG: hypothetical protein AAF352_08440, partial [Pseudomonadota bacterium]